MHSVYCSLASGYLCSTQLEWATGPNNILLRNTHYTISTNSPENFPDFYWSNSTIAFIQWNWTVSYQVLYGCRINVLCTQSPCHCGYCLTQPWIVSDCLKDLQARIVIIMIIIIIILSLYGAFQGLNEANNFFFIEMEHNMLKNPNW